MDFSNLNLDVASASWIIADVGALNWGLQEAFGVNLVTEAVGAGSAGLVYLVVGLAGALGLADKLGVVDLGEIA